MNKFRRWLLKLLLFEIGIIKAEPGDTVVFRTPEYINMAIQRDLDDQLTRVVPDNKVLVLYGGAEIEFVKGAGTDGGMPEEGTYSLDYIDAHTVRLRKVAF